MKSNKREDSKCLNIMFIDDIAISYVGSLYLIFRKLKLEFNGNCVKRTTCLCRIETGIHDTDVTRRHKSIDLKKICSGFCKTN